MSIQVAAVSSSAEGYRIVTGLHHDQVREYANGIHLAEAFAMSLIEKASIRAQLDEIARDLKKYVAQAEESGNNADWKYLFDGLRQSIEATFDNFLIVRK